MKQLTRNVSMSDINVRSRIHNKKKTAVDLLGGIHGEPENGGFHKQNFDYLRFEVYQTLNRACTTCEYNIRIKATKLIKQRENSSG